MFFSERIDLHLPGPTIVPPAVERAIDQALRHPMMDYRTEAFRSVLREASQSLSRALGTRHESMFLSGSGAAALETAMVNLVEASDTIIICVAGYFGEYLTSIAARIGCKVVRLDVEWGTHIDPAAVEVALRAHPETRAVFMTQCETSTGVLNDVEAVAGIVSRTDAVLVVDAVGSFLASELQMDAWGVDVVATASQKALMLPPGLAILAVNSKAWSRIEERPTKSHYFNLTAYKNAPSAGTTPFTPNVPLINAVRASLAMVNDEGLSNFQARHELLRDMTRAAMTASGIRLFVEEADRASHTLTAVATDSFDADQIRTVLREELRVSVGGGLGRLQGRILRLGHLGYTTPLDTIRVIAGLEVACNLCGMKVRLGAGVAAAQDLLVERSVTRSNVLEVVTA